MNSGFSRKTATVFSPLALYATWSLLEIRQLEIAAGAGAGEPDEDRSLVVQFLQIDGVFTVGRLQHDFGGHLRIFLGPDGAGEESDGESGGEETTHERPPQTGGTEAASQPQARPTGETG